MARSAPAGTVAGAGSAFGWLWRLLTAVLLLLPIGAEAALRAAKPSELLAIGAGYCAVVVLFAVFAPAAPRLAAAAPCAWPARPWLVPAALAVTALGWYIAAGDARRWVLVPLWLLGIGLWSLAWVGTGRPRPPGWRRALPVALLLAGAATGRFYDLGMQPLQVDELAIMESTLRRTMDDPLGPTGLPLFNQNAHDGYSQVLLGTYPRIALFEWAGVDIVTMRIPSALLGVVEVGLLFLLGRQLFGYRAGLIAAGILATLNAHLTFSRHGGDNLEGSFLWTTVGLLLAIGFARRSAAALALAGVATSGALYLYMSGRAAPAFVAGLLVLAALDPRVRGRWLGTGTLALVGGFLVGAGPVLVAYARTPAIYAYKSNVTAWLTPALDRFRATGEPAQLMPLWEHFYRALLAYNIVPSADHHYWPERGFFYLLPAGLLYGGVALVSLRLGDWRHRMLALWFWIPTVGLSALSDFPPPGHRILPVLPACALLIAMSLDRVVLAWQQVGGVARRLAVPLAGVAIGGAMLQEAVFYFGDFAHRDLDRFQDKLVRHILEAPPGRHFVLVPGHQPNDLSIHFATDLERRNTVGRLHRAVDDLPYLGSASAGVTYLVNAERLFWFDVIRDAYPTGRISRLTTEDPRHPDRLVWMALTVDGTELEAARGLEAVVRDGAGRRLERRVPGIDLPVDLPVGLVYPLDVEWRGWLQHRAGREATTVRSTGTVVPEVKIGDRSLELGGRPVPLDLPYGGQPLFARARLGSRDDRLRVEWSRGSRAEPAVFGAGQTSTAPGPPRVTVDWLTPDGRELVRRDYDVMIADFALGLRHPSSRPYLIRWSAELAVDQPGLYEFEPVGDGPLRLTVNGRQVWPASGGPQPPGGPPERSRATLRLVAGRHALVLERVRTEGGQAALLWRRGEGAMTVVPASAFAPMPWP